MDQVTYETKVAHAGSNRECAAQVKYLVLAVKSQYFDVVFEEIKDVLTKEQVKQLALTHFSQFLSELEENGVRIVDKNVMIEQIDKNYHIYGQVKGCEKITTLVPTERKREEPVNESE